MSSIEAIITKEIKEKAKMLVAESIILENGDHMSFYHVGLSDEQLKERAIRYKKTETSTFTSKEALLKCIKDYLLDEKGTEKIVRWIMDPAAPDRSDEFDGVIFDEEPIGRVYLKEEDSYEDCYGYKLVLRKNDRSYRSIYTGLPFEFVTVYAEE